MNAHLNGIYQSLKKHKSKLEVICSETSCHLAVNGDCEKVMSNIPDGSVNLVITDPPYNQGVDYGIKFNDRKRWPEYYDWLKSKLSNIPRILKSDGSFYLISYPEINARLLPYLEDELGLKFRRWITWHYPSNIGHSRKNFTRSQRSILFFTKTNDYVFNRENLLQHYKNPTAPVVRKRIEQGFNGRISYDLLRFLDIIELQKGLIDVLDINLVKNNSKDRYRNLFDKFHTMTKEELKILDHPCQLPVMLLEILVKVSSSTNSIVFDPFAGTFTTSQAALNCNRNSIGSEINMDYIKFGINRLSGSLNKSK